MFSKNVLVWSNLWGRLIFELFKISRPLQKEYQKPEPSMLPLNVRELEVAAKQSSE